MSSRTRRSVVFEFVQDRLISGEKSFFDPIPRKRLSTGIKKKQKTKASIEILKEDKQAFGLMVSKSVSMEEAFNFPITSVPLSIDTTEYSLRQSDKSQFRNLLIKKSESTTDVAPKRCAWFIDGMAAIRSLKAKTTYKEFIYCLVQFVTPSRELEPNSVGIINDTYIEKSIKEGTRKDRGDKGPRVHFSNVNQRMLQGVQWESFFHNGENKENLISAIADYLQSKEGRSKLRCPVVITSNERTYQITNRSSEMLFHCNHEEADSRLILHAILANQDVVVVAKDTDVLVLLVWAYEKYSVTHQWFMKYERDSFADVGKICRFIGRQLCLSLPAFHSISGCDTTSYMF